MDQDTLRFLLREAVRETVTEVLQTVLELDRTAFLQTHGGRRNGYYPRRLETTFGQVDLKVPRDREGQYYPAFLKPYARRLVDVGEVAVALYAAGVSQRKAAEVMSFLLGHRYSHETISAMTEEVLQAVEAFRRRPLPEEMAFVYLDGLYLKLLREGEGVVREVVYVALGVTPSGERWVLGYWLLPAESALGWEGVLGELWQRGLRRVLLFITDGLPGLPEAIQRVYPQAEWQRCVVHGVRWSLGQVRARDRVLLAEDLRRVYGAESRGEALEALEALREAWGSRYPGVVALWAGDSGAFLRFYGYPKVLWPYLRSTNLMERFIREIRRGTKVRDHKFPGEEAVYKLLYLGHGRQPVSWVGEARREVGGAKAQGVLGGEGDAREDASGAVCPPYTNAYTYILTRPSPRAKKRKLGAKEGPCGRSTTGSGRPTRRAWRRCRRGPWPTARSPISPPSPFTPRRTSGSWTQSTRRSGASPASTPTPGGSMAPCTGPSSGPCACSPGSAPPSRPTSASRSS
jgi:putative transposase